MPVGNLEFIKSASGTSVTTINVTDIFTEKYDVYMVSISKIDLSATFGVNLRLLDSGGTPITTSNYNTASLSLNAGSAFGETRYTNLDRFINFGVYSSGSEVGGATIAYFYNPYDNSSYTFWQLQSAGEVTGSGGFRGLKAIGVLPTAATHSGISLTSNGANLFDNITVNVYGVK